MVLVLFEFEIRAVNCSDLKLFLQFPQINFKEGFSQFHLWSFNLCVTGLGSSEAISFWFCREKLSQRLEAISTIERELFSSILQLPNEKR